ncbi:NAD(P)/FAD-dependent oxidoreductase [Aeromicrobium sp.]|uniref:NAD(P)/FAD-dependent oxidoreductase n=1 Tax=Aeromicrobium sp. TaxID=1871063 RepID=UPI003D6C4105
MHEYDVVIVGARCAGSPLATMLAQAGLEVCIVDQARFPSDTLSTHLVQSHGVAILERLGIRDTLLDLGAVEIDHISLINDDVRIDGEAEPGDLPALCVRRVTLDDVLVKAAEAAGAEVRTSTRVTGMLRDDGRMVGVETGDGPIRARLVVGADGMRSSVAEWVGAREYHVVPGGRMFAVAYFDGVSDSAGHLRIGRVGDNAFIAAPADGLYMAGVGISISESQTFMADRDGSFDRGLRAWPELADLVAGSTRVGPIRMITEWHSFFREAAGPGWALVGDAGHFKDFTPGQGISDALRQVDHLAPAIVAGLAGDLDADLRHWWSWRDDDAWDMYWFASDLGSPGASTPLETRMMRNVSNHPDGARDLIKVFDHQISPWELFSTRRLVLASMQALVDRPGRIGPTLREIVTSAKEQRRREKVRPASVEPLRLPVSIATV